MEIRGIEDRVLERFLYRVDPADADGMRRYPPLRRDQFDALLFDATRWVVGEASQQSFGGACRRYQAANRFDQAELRRPVPLVPPSVTASVAQFVSQWRSPEAGEPRVSGERITKREANLRDQLYLDLGGDRDDGPGAAGLRVHSQMWSARIGDGFVHPAVGAHVWSDIPASSAQELEQTGGPHIAAIAAAGALARQWQNEPADRPSIERHIMDLAHTLGWRDETP